MHAHAVSLQLPAHSGCSPGPGATRRFPGRRCEPQRGRGLWGRRRQSSQQGQRAWDMGVPQNACCKWIPSRLYTSQGSKWAVWATATPCPLTPGQGSPLRACTAQWEGQFVFTTAQASTHQLRGPSPPTTATCCRRGCGIAAPAVGILPPLPSTSGLLAPSCHCWSQSPARGLCCPCLATLTPDITSSLQTLPLTAHSPRALCTAQPAPAGSSCSSSQRQTRPHPCREELLVWGPWSGLCQPPALPARAQMARSLVAMKW